MARLEINPSLAGDINLIIGIVILRGELRTVGDSTYSHILSAISAMFLLRGKSWEVYGTCGNTVVLGVMSCCVSPLCS